jgi:hypothetical protein
MDSFAWVAALDLSTAFQKYSDIFTTESQRTRRRIQFSSVCREATANGRASPAVGGAGFLAHRRLPMGKKVEETSVVSMPPW